MKQFLTREWGFNQTNYSIEEIYIKEEPPQDYLVSECDTNVFYNFLFF